MWIKHKNIVNELNKYGTKFNNNNKKKNTHRIALDLKAAIIIEKFHEVVSSFIRNLTFSVGQILKKKNSLA